MRKIFAYIRGFIRPEFSQRTQPASPKPDTSGTSDENKKTDRRQLYVIWDALGDGRVVGVFDNEELVRKILAINPYYYRYYICTQGEPTRTALDWLDSGQRQKLENITRQPALQDSTTPEPLRGQIRAARATDFERMTEIWLQASLAAHDFISSDFWHANAESMRSKYLPSSENLIYVENDKILGFISLQKNNVAALFVTPEAQGRGIGKTLLDQAKKSHDTLSLAVYERNSRSVSFYSHQGFVVLQSRTDPHTGETELIMQLNSQK